MIKGFKEFLMRGNVVELAVAVVMGAALTALVASFGAAFLNPLITLVTGGAEVGGSFTVNGVEFPYGVFVNGLLVFFLTSVAVYFVIVMPMNKLRDRFMSTEEEAEVVREEQVVLLEQIRDLLREQHRDRP
jgi:large conductance mechanosensitive channel